MNKKQALALILAVSMTVPTFTNTSLAVKENFNEVKNVLSDEVKKEKNNEFKLIMDTPEISEYKIGDTVEISVYIRNAKGLLFGDFAVNTNPEYLNPLPQHDLYNVFLDESLDVDSEVAYYSAQPKNDEKVTGNYKLFTLKYKLKKMPKTFEEIINLNTKSEAGDLDEDFNIIFKNQLDRVYIEYLDNFGSTISDKTYVKGFEGEDYKLEDKEIEGYTLEKVEGDKEGVFPDGSKTVKYIYKDNNFNIEDDWSTEDFNFEGTVLKGFSPRGLEKFKLGKTELIIPEKNADGEVITEIGEKAFDRKKFTKLVLNEGLEIIGKEAFIFCEINGELVLPSTVKKLSDSSFQRNNFENVKFNDLITELPEGVFNKNKISGTLILPKNIKKIDKLAFGRNNINKLILNEELIEIGTSAFQNNNINEIVFNEKLETIKNLAFLENKLSGEIIIPNSIKEIDGAAFRSNPSKDSTEKLVFKFKDGKNINHIPDGENFIVEGEKPVVAGGDITVKYIDEDGKEIKDSKVLKGNKFEKTKIEPEEIEGYKLLDNKVKEVEFTDKTQEIVFKYDKLIKDYKVEDFVFEGTVLKGFSEKGLEKFKNGSTELTIPEKNANGEAITEIGENAFSKNTINPGLKKNDRKPLIGKLVIPNTVKSINKYAFNDNEFTELILNEGIEEILNSAFASNKISGEFIMPSTLKTIKEYAFIRNSIESIKFNDAITEIENSTFTNNNLKGTLEIPKNIKIIDKFAFSSNEIEKLVIEEGLEKINQKAFENNRLSGEIIIPNSIKEIDKHAFKSNPSVENPEKVILKFKDGKNINSIPDGENFIVEGEKPVVAGGDITVKYLDKEGKEISESTVFSGNIGDSKKVEPKEIEGYKLVEGETKEYKFTDKAQEIVFKYEKEASKEFTADDFTFTGNILTGLSTEGEEKLNRGEVEFKLPTENKDGEKITEIGEKAFYGKDIKGELIIPETVKVIGVEAFYNNKIESVKLNEGLESIEDSAFNSNKIAGKLNLPKTLKNISKAAFSSNEITEIDPGENLNEIGREAFKNNMITGKLIIPSNITKLGAYAFSGNIINGVDIQANIEKIEREVFANNQIENVKISNSVKIIEKNAFYNNKINSLNLNEGLKQIKENAFDKNNLSGEIAIPSSVEKINKTAFNNNGSEKIILNLQDKENKNNLVDGNNFTIKKPEVVRGEDIIVKYLDEEGKEISESTVLSGNIGETEKIEPKKIDGYKLAEGEAKEYKFTDKSQEVVFKYEKEKSEVVKGEDITIKYLDEEGKEISESTVLNGNIGETEKIEPKDIDGYKLVEGEAKEYKFTDKAQEVVFKYEKEKSEVVKGEDITVKYLDKEGKEISESIVLSGNIGDSKKVEPKEIEGYKLVEGEAKEYKFTDKAQEIVFKYEKEKPAVVKGEDITIKYLDKEGKEISESTVLSGNIGDIKKVEPKEIDGYKLVEGETKEYKFTDKAQEIVFKYEKEKSEVVKGEDITIKYLDNEGKEISKSIILSGNIGDSKKVEPKEIDGYKLVEGETKEYKFTDKAQEIVFKYEKKKSSGSTNTDDTNGTVNNFEVNRIKGSNRYSTAVEVSKAMYEKTDTVILVNGYKEADALTSSVLSDVYNAPILLTEKDNIPSETLKEIKRLGAKNILIIGGEGSISENLKSSLKGFNIERISGKNRYETSEKVAERIVEKTGKVNKFTIVRGDIFPDALAVSGLGIKEIAPIILTDRNKLSENNLNLLKENKADKVFIVGGNNSISENIEKEINKFSKADRISGKNRYETSIEIAKKLSDSIENIIIASGENGIDAMVAGPLTRKKKASIILSQKSNISDSLKAYLEKEGKNIKGISIIGGENTISSNIEKELK